ncbi:MAG: thioredoxin family protein [Prevotellaceae bacterium]|nr:thioredoxin family protein [Prevotellaceae bacterium]
MITLFTCQLYKKHETGKLYANIPDIVLLSADSVEYNLSCMKQDTAKPAVIFFFHPDCKLCEAEISNIIERPEILCEAKVLFVSSASIEKIKTFLKKYPLQDLTDVTVVSDFRSEFKSLFNPSTIPCIYIYDRNHKLDIMIKGLLKSETIQKLINRAYGNKKTE